MPDDNLEGAIKEAYAVARINDPAIETIEIYHPAMDSVYLARDKVGHDFTLEDGVTVAYFEPVAFKAQRPKQGESGAQELTVVIDNVDRRIGQWIKAVKFSQQEAKIRYRIYLASVPGEPQTIEPVELTISEVTLTALEVTIRAKFVDFLNRPFPNQRYTRARFPSLGD